MTKHIDEIESSFKDVQMAYMGVAAEILLTDQGKNTEHLVQILNKGYNKLLDMEQKFIEIKEQIK